VIIEEILNDLAPEKTPSLKEGLTWEADNGDVALGQMRAVLQ